MSQSDKNLTIIPVSVIDIGKQNKRIVEKDHHNNKSSRSGFSPFPDEINTLCYEFFLRDCSLVFDPFAGWGERGSKAKTLNIPYYGVDISQEAIDHAKSEYGVINTKADARTCTLPKSYDGLCTCPPTLILKSTQIRTVLTELKNGTIS